MADHSSFVSPRPADHERPFIFRFFMMATAIIFLLTAVIQIPAQDPAPSPSPSPSPQATPPDDASTKKEKRGNWILAPIPINSPALGAGLILGVGYVFKLDMKDKTSQPSTIGAAGAFTNSGSRGLAIGGRLYFHENKYQTAFAFAKGRANYDFYGIGRAPGTDGIVVEMKQAGSIFFGEFMRNFGKQIFIGPRFQYRRLTASLGGVPGPGGFQIPQIDITSRTSALGVHIQRDLRDNVFYPRRGSLFDVKADFFGKWIGSNRTYQTYVVSYNGYHSIGPKQVLAYRVMACGVTDTAPFYDLCFYGRNDLRGYTSGEFQDRRSFATQVEFRQELPYRLGIVGFVGVGSIARRFSDLEWNRLLPAAGVGLRFKLDKTNHINYRIDLGFGRNGHTLAFSVTEAF